MKLIAVLVVLLSAPAWADEYRDFGYVDLKIKQGQIELETERQGDDPISYTLGVRSDSLTQDLYMYCDDEFQCNKRIALLEQALEKNNRKLRMKVVYSEDSANWSCNTSYRLQALVEGQAMQFHLYTRRSGDCYRESTVFPLRCPRRSDFITRKNDVWVCKGRNK